MVHAFQGLTGQSRLGNQGGSKLEYVVLSVQMMGLLDKECQGGTHPPDWWTASHEPLVPPQAEEVRGPQCSLLPDPRRVLQQPGTEVRPFLEATPLLIFPRSNPHSVSGV